MTGCIITSQFHGPCSICIRHVLHSLTPSSGQTRIQSSMLLSSVTPCACCCQAHGSGPALVWLTVVQAFFMSSVHHWWIIEPGLHCLVLCMPLLWTGRPRNFTRHAYTATTDAFLPAVMSCCNEHTFELGRIVHCFVAVALGSSHLKAWRLQVVHNYFTQEGLYAHAMATKKSTIPMQRFCTCS
jgi:hypothetical protein